jgi:hypothetical protein
MGRGVEILIGIKRSLNASEIGWFEGRPAVEHIFISGYLRFTSHVNVFNYL